MQFPAMRRLSITTANAFLIVYAVDDLNSYEVLKMCVSEIRDIRADFQVNIEQFRTKRRPMRLGRLLCA